MSDSRVVRSQQCRQCGKKRTPEGVEVLGRVALQAWTRQRMPDMAGVAAAVQVPSNAPHPTRCSRWAMLHAHMHVSRDCIAMRCARA